MTSATLQPSGGVPGAGATVGGRAVLQRRLAITLLLLAIAQLPRSVPLPGLDPHIFMLVSGWLDDGTAHSVFRITSRARLSFGALGVTPYFTAWLLAHAAAAFVPAVEAMKNGNLAARQRFNDYIRFGTVGVAWYQGYLVAQMLEALHTTAGHGVVVDPGFISRAIVAASLVAASMLMLWLAELITAFGIGYGLPLLLVSGYLLQLPGDLLYLFDAIRVGALAPPVVLLLLAALCAAGWVAVRIGLARRRVVVEFPGERDQDRSEPDTADRYQLSLNPAGIVPLVVAASLLKPVFASPSSARTSGAGLLDLAQWVPGGAPVLVVAYFLVFVVMSIYLGRMALKPTTLEELRWRRAIVEDMPPGVAAADHLRGLSTRLIAFGASCLAVVAILPSWLLFIVSVPVVTSGPTLVAAMLLFTEIVSFRKRRRPTHDDSWEAQIARVF